MSQGRGGAGSGGDGGWLRRPGRWLAGRTLRGRLIAGVVALLAVACATVGVVTYIVLRGSLLGQLDQQLHTAGSQYARCEESGGAQGENDGAALPAGSRESEFCNLAGLASGTFSAKITDGGISNMAVTSRPSVSLASLSPADQHAILTLPTSQRYRSYEFSALGPYRLTASAAPDGAVYVTGLPLDNVETTLRNVAITEIIVFSAALVLTGFIGTGWVRLSLRPLRRVAATATRVTQLPLASGEVALPERVPDADPRTEVGQVGSAFNRMLGHVGSALARRASSEARLRRFAADASHELRTPLTAIRGYAELARRHPGPIPPDIAHALGRIESESARMSVLVDELLLLAQLDAGRPLAAEPVDLTRLAIDAASDARAATPSHRWQLELPDEPVMVRGDEHRLRQVLANLLSNAGRHTPPGTTVTMALAAGTGSGEVVLSVTDNGPGIPPDLQPGLFERFVRGDTSRSHATGSTGLGLAIVDAVTTAHGGSVSVASRAGMTRFAITLPAFDAPPAPGSSWRPGQPPQGAERTPADGPADSGTADRGTADRGRARSRAAAGTPGQRLGPSGRPAPAHRTGGRESSPPGS